MNDRNETQRNVVVRGSTAQDTQTMKLLNALRSLPSLPSFISLVKQHVALAIEDERRVVRLAAMCGDSEKARRLDKDFRARAWLASRETNVAFDEAYEREVDKWIAGTL